MMEFPLQVNVMMFVFSAFWRCSFILTLTLPWLTLPVIDMMVDPDGAMDSLSNLGVSVSPGTQPGPEISAGSTSSRPEANAGQPCGPPGKTEVAEPGSAPAQASRSHKWSTTIASYLEDASLKVPNLQTKTRGFGTRLWTSKSNFTRYRFQPRKKYIQKEEPDSNLWHRKQLFICAFALLHHRLKLTGFNKDSLYC